MGKGEGVDALCGNWGGNFSEREPGGLQRERKLATGFRVGGGGLVDERGCRSGRAVAESNCMRVDGSEFAPWGKGERGMRLSKIRAALGGNQLGSCEEFWGGWQG